MRSFSIERQRTSDRASKPQAGTPDIGAQPDPTPAVSTIFGATHGSKTPDFRRDGWSPPYPASQGNRASSTAMARVVVSWGATRAGAAAGAVVRRARRARWLRP